MRGRLTITLAVVLAVVLAAVVVVGLRWWQQRDATAFAEATSYAPADAERLSWTDWAAVRDTLGSDSVDDLLDRAFDEDLSSASALVESAPVLESELGFSPASVDWELFSQSSAGAVVIVRLPEEADVDAVADRLDAAGYTPPEDPDGVWSGGEAVLPELGANLTPELQYAALLADERLVLTSDRADYLEDVLDDVDDGERLSEPMQQVVDASGEPLTAVVYDGPHTCSALAMSHADAEEQATAERLVAEAGEVDPVAAYAMSVQPDRQVRVVLGFEDADQARANADSRAALAAGPAPGQGGSFADRFTVASATAEDELVTLDLTPVEGTYVFSDLSSGPVLFATC